MVIVRLLNRINEPIWVGASIVLYAIVAVALLAGAVWLDPSPCRPGSPGIHIANMKVQGC